MIQEFLRRAAAGQSVYITDVREAFQAKGTRPFHLHVTLYDRSVRAFNLRLPETAGEDEERFVAEYVYANVYNLLSSLGGIRVDIYLNQTDGAALALAERNKRDSGSLSRMCGASRVFRFSFAFFKKRLLFHLDWSIIIHISGEKW